MCITDRNLNASTNSEVLEKYNINLQEYLELTQELFPNLSKNSCINKFTSTFN